jgi:hypothetical protein
MAQQDLYPCPHNERMMCDMLLPCIGCKSFAPNKEAQKSSYNNARDVIFSHKVCTYCCATQEQCKKCSLEFPSSFTGRKLTPIA